ncbi:MAG: type IV secretion system protein, partial [Sphingomicrobium sp.]
MNSCEPLGVHGPAGIADALQKVDCLANEATSISFGRLFGEQGAFHNALTILLTLYVALLAVNLLTGRSALRLSVLTPKMMTLGLTLTFVTSWIAYQSVVWNLAVGAPDEIAGVLVGTKGSATGIFAQRLDLFFTAISDAAAAIPVSATPTLTLASPANILSLASLILLLGTVGVLVVCRLVLAALLILGPVFIVLALFDHTRGLFEGWLKSVATFALVPLLTVVIGSGALMAMDPMIADISAGGGEISLRTAVTVLVASIIYLSLMLMVFKVANTLTRGWRLGRAVTGSAVSVPSLVAATRSHAAPMTNPPTSGSAARLSSDRVRATIASFGASTTIDQRFDARSMAASVSRALPASFAPTAAPTPLRRGSTLSLPAQVTSPSLARETLR